nr:MAG TPA: hypothetical protein [Caudoviricetes sp.]
MQNKKRGRLKICSFLFIKELYNSHSFSLLSISILTFRTLRS